MKRCEAIMTPDPVTCGPWDSAAAAARWMLAADVGALPVVEGEEGWLVGMITKGDIARRVVARGLDLATTPVHAAMTHEIVACLPDDDIGKAIERMEDHGLMRLPIIDEDGRLTGIVTRTDMTVRGGPAEPFADLFEEIHAED